MTGPTPDSPNAPWRAFPWHELERLPREVVSTLRDTRRAVRAALDEPRIGQAVGELVGDRVTVRVVRVAVAIARPPPLPGAVRFALASIDDGLRVELDLDQDLARSVVGRVLGRPFARGDGTSAASPELLGAACAVASAIARRAHGETGALLPVGPGGHPWPEGERRIRVDAAVVVGADAYHARATIQVLRTPPHTRRTDRSTLAALGAVPIRLPVVAAASSAAAGQVFELAPGDIWLPGEGWSAARCPASAPGEPRLIGRVALTPRGAQRGIAASLGEDGELVVLGVEPMPIDEPPDLPHANDTATSEVVLDAPLVVRVEVGAVTMTAREWAEIAPGDVIAIGRRIAEPVVLRVAGVEVARGELVDVEGELGVRIRERAGAT